MQLIRDAMRTGSSFLKIINHLNHLPLCNSERSLRFPCCAFAFTINTKGYALSTMKKKPIDYPIFFLSETVEEPFFCSERPFYGFPWPLPRTRSCSRYRAPPNPRGVGSGGVFYMDSMLTGRNPEKDSLPACFLAQVGVMLRTERINSD